MYDEVDVGKNVDGDDDLIGCCEVYFEIGVFERIGLVSFVVLLVY